MCVVVVRYVRLRVEMVGRRCSEELEVSVFCCLRESRVVD